MKTYETENYIINFCEGDVAGVKAVAYALDECSQRVLDFFQLERLKNKVRVVIWNTIDGYKKNIMPYLKEDGVEYEEWMIGDTMDGNINMLSIDEVRKTNCRMDNYGFDEFLDTACHEFVHICHKQVKAKFKRSDSWLAEALAINLGNDKTFQKQLEGKGATAILDDVKPGDLVNDFDNIRNSYLVAYILGRWLFANCPMDYIFSLATDSNKLRKETSRIFEKAKSSIAMDEFF